MVEGEDEPQTPREFLPLEPGFLRNGVRRGDPRNAPRCGAKTRMGTPCQSPSVRGRRRCRMHGGTCRGPTTAAGLERSRTACWKTGYYSAEAIEERRQARELLRQAREFIEALDDAG